eukprot:2646899-Alexandrium_andersonii.AAC.1
MPAHLAHEPEGVSGGAVAEGAEREPAGRGEGGLEPAQPGLAASGDGVEVEVPQSDEGGYVDSGSGARASLLDKGDYANLA